MKQNRNKDSNVPQRHSETGKAPGSGEAMRGRAPETPQKTGSPGERNRSSSDERSRSRDSVMDDEETFEHGVGESEMTRGMSSGSERGRGKSER